MAPVERAAIDMAPIERAPIERAPIEKAPVVYRFQQNTKTYESKITITKITNYLNIPKSNSGNSTHPYHRWGCVCKMHVYECARGLALGVGPAYPVVAWRVLNIRTPAHNQHETGMSRCLAGSIRTSVRLASKSLFQINSNVKQYKWGFLLKVKTNNSISLLGYDSNFLPEPFSHRRFSLMLQLV